MKRYYAYKKLYQLVNFSRVCSNVSLLHRETSVHAGDGRCRDAASYGGDASANIADAHGHTKPGALSEAQRIRHEHTSTFDPEAGVEAAEGLGGLRQVLRAHAAAKLRCYLAATTGAVGGGVTDGQ